MNDIVEITLIKNEFSNALVSLTERYKNIICLDTDITNSIGINLFKKSFLITFSLSVFQNKILHRMKIIGIAYTFGKSGSPEESLQKYGLRLENIYNKAIKLIKKK